MTLLDILHGWKDRLDTPVVTWHAQTGDTPLTRAAFRAKATAVAARLAELAKPGERVFMVYPPGPDFLVAFFGALHAGVVAVPVYPPDRRPHSVQRFQALIRDARPAVIMGTEEVRTQASLLPELAQMRWLCTDRLDVSAAAAYRPPDVGDESVAFIQYTSGSTGTPRGVVHTHRNVRANMLMIRRALDVHATTHGVIWLPLYHDMGLITTLVTMEYGDQLTLLSPVAFLRDPLLWLRTISRTSASHSGGPNFAFDLCARKATQADVASLDLSSWTHAYNGAEPIRLETLQRFTKVFGPCGFRSSAFMPCYGLAEATLLVSVGRVGAGPVTFAADAAALAADRVQQAAADRGARALVASGPIDSDAEVAVVKPQTGERCAPDEVGEIWVRGPGIGVGYWLREQDSEATFRARTVPDGEGPYLRTGDLGFIRQGQLFVTGRLKDLIVIRGHNYYPQDIEAVVGDAHPAIRRGCAVAAAVEGAHGEELAVFFELDEAVSGTAEQALAAVKAAVSESFALKPLVIGVVARGGVPKTSSGKLQRSACRQAFLSGALPMQTVEDRRSLQSADETQDADPSQETPDEAQAVDAALLQELVAHLIDHIGELVGDRVREDDVVTRVGLTSVSAIDIMFSVEERFGLTMTAEELTDSVTIRELARRMLGGERAQSRPAAPAAHAGSSQAGPVELSLMYFSTDTLSNQARYDIFLESAAFADKHDFKALWVPERHFHPFGGTYPNPAVAAAALAIATQRIRLRAGSVVLPLHDPIRVAEEWSLVDNLSGGRVDLAFATGWNPNDFALAPERFERRREVTNAGIERVRQLWTGGGVVARNGRNEDLTIKTYPTPVQKTLNVWRTCTTNAEGFAEAGAAGYHVLTALLFMRMEELEQKVRLYREARARHGHDPAAGIVTVMLHTFVSGSVADAEAKAEAPFKRYLASSIDLWKREWPALDGGDGRPSDELLDVAFKRYVRGNALIGTPQSCMELIKGLQRIGVNEVACLIDFGIEAQLVLTSLTHLNKLRSLAQGEAEQRPSELFV